MGRGGVIISIVRIVIAQNILLLLLLFIALNKGHGLIGSEQGGVRSIGLVGHLGYILCFFFILLLLLLHKIISFYFPINIISISIIIVI